MDRGPGWQGTLSHKTFSYETIDLEILESEYTVLEEKLILLLMFGMLVSAAMSYFLALKMMRR